MELTGIINKLDNPKLGNLLGYLAGAQVEGVASGTNAIPIIMAQINGLLTNPHIPDFNKVIQSLTNDYYAQSKVFKPALMVGLIGYILDEIGINPTVNRIAKTAKTLGINVALGVALQAAVSLSSIYSSPMSPQAAAIIGGGSGGNSEVPNDSPFLRLRKWD